MFKLVSEDGRRKSTVLQIIRKSVIPGGSTFGTCHCVSPCA